MASKFNKRHYVAIADVLAREVAPVISQDQLRTVVTNFSAMFRADNTRFSSERFREYVEDQQEKIRQQRIRKAG